MNNRQKAMQARSAPTKTKQRPKNLRVAARNPKLDRQLPQKNVVIKDKLRIGDPVLAYSRGKPGNFGLNPTFTSMNVIGTQAKADYENFKVSTLPDKLKNVALAGGGFLERSIDDGKGMGGEISDGISTQVAASGISGETDGNSKLQKQVIGDPGLTIKKKRRTRRASLRAMISKPRDEGLI